MNWEELDKYLVEIFHTKKEKEPIIQTEETISQTIASEEFSLWLDDFMVEMDRFDELSETRLTCIFCKCRINDDRFVIMQNPKFPNDTSKQIYFHSKGGCNPRYRYIKEARELWLFRYKNRNNHKTWN